MRLRNQLVVTAENYKLGENLSPKQIQSLSKDVDEQLNRAHQVVNNIYQLTLK